MGERTTKRERIEDTLAAPPPPTSHQFVVYYLQRKSEGPREAVLVSCRNANRCGELAGTNLCFLVGVWFICFLN
ncbi:hypothetical protein HanHA300_Chr01g0026001 [Helianthus annuus]|nr:hypothetical protein HanHA300_Chr01g0026001 [Helianthus annuus]